jgi:hypothetical protein
MKLGVVNQPTNVHQILHLFVTNNCRHQPPTSQNVDATEGFAAMFNALPAASGHRHCDRRIRGTVTSGRRTVLSRPEDTRCVRKATDTPRPDAIYLDSLHPEAIHCVQKAIALTLLVRNVYAMVNVVWTPFAMTL